MGAQYLKPEFPPLLKPGRHELTLAELRSLCVAHRKFKISITRREIIMYLEEVIDRLCKGGIVGEIWIDGSFVTEKIDPSDVDTLLRVSSDIYDNDERKRKLIDWASHENLRETHLCDSYKWVEYTGNHPLFDDSERDRLYWSRFFGHSIRKVAKGIAVIKLPVASQ